MRKVIAFMALLVVGGTAGAQTSNTNCTSYIPNSVQCTTTTTPSVDWGAFQRQQQEQQQQMNQAFQNIGAAIAARRERKRQEQEAQNAAIEQKAVQDAIQTAIDNDPDRLNVPPADEPPVMLVCHVGNATANVALYEKHAQVTTSAGGLTRTRAAVFTSGSITWNSAIARNTVNRLDGSYSMVGTFHAVEGQTANGTCSVATERKF